MFYFKSSYDVDGCDGTDLAAEAGILAKIGHHENIVRLLGVCSKNGESTRFYFYFTAENLCRGAVGPLWVVLEFAEQGNLLSYLRAQRRQGLVDCGASYFKKKTIFGLQIASGMKYLASKRVSTVHEVRLNICRLHSVFIAIWPPEMFSLAKTKY